MEMRKVVILGASGTIAGHVVDMLVTHNDVHLKLVLRDARRLRNKAISKCRIIEGDVLDYSQLGEGVKGQDIVYANLAGDLESMARNIVEAMKENGVKRLIFISSIGIYEHPLKSVLKPYRKSVDVIEASDLDYTILRPTWFRAVDEVDYEITKKGEPEKGSVVSQKSIASLIVKIIKSPECYVRESLGVNKPNS